MKRYIVGILFFSGLWGLSEALLGGWLYAAKIPYASAPLTIIAFAILTVALLYLPKAGVATVIALCAMLFKFFNEPFFACHLLGIAMLGICYDVFFTILRIKSKMLSALAAAIVNYVLFALMMTYVTNNGFWNTSKLLGHIREGFFAAIACAIIVPLILNIKQVIKKQAERPTAANFKPAQIFVSMTAVCIWAFGIAAYFIHR